MSRPRKRSLTLSGHRTSVSLEEEFWQAFREIAAERGVAPARLATEIDRARGLETGLATAIRLFVLAEYRRRLGLGPGRDRRARAGEAAPGGTGAPESRGQREG